MIKEENLRLRAPRVTNQADRKLPGRDSCSGLGAATVHEAAAGIGALPSSIKPLRGEFCLFGAAFTGRSMVIDPYWLELFPDPESRPASHTFAYQLPDPMRIQSEFFGGE